MLTYRFAPSEKDPRGFFLGETAKKELNRLAEMTSFAVRRDHRGYHSNFQLYDFPGDFAALVTDGTGSKFDTDRGVVIPKNSLFFYRFDILPHSLDSTRFLAFKHLMDYLGEFSETHNIPEIEDYRAISIHV